MKIVPNEGLLLVKPHEVDSKTPGGIVLPDAAKDLPEKATVIGVGPTGEEWQPNTIAQGDTILYKRARGTKVKIHGEDYLVLGRQDVLLIYQEEDE